MKNLKAVLAEGGVAAPGIYDALTAVLAKQAGFSTAYVSGFAFEATQLGAPDMGIATMTELVDHVRRIVSAAPDLNVIVDVDTGFGGVNNLYRTVKEFSLAGAAAIQIEDQADPKRCPFLGKRKVVDQETAVARIKLAAEAAHNSNMLIIARTDADELGFDEVVTRCRRFAEVGADLVLPMINSLDGKPFKDRSPDERMAIYGSLQNSIGHPMVTLDPPPGFSAYDLFDAGISLVISPLQTLQAASNAVIAYLQSLHETGASENYKAAHPPQLQANLDMMKILGLDDYEARLDAMP